MRTFAAVDIGSNSVRIKMARVIRHRLETIHEDRVVTRLGESAFRFGTLSPEAMENTVKVLRRFYRDTQDFGVDQVRVVATSALRDAPNAAAFIAWVYSATGWKVETISGLEEGRLIHLGVMANTTLGASRALLLDLGGGSCELTLSEKGHIREMVSLPLGAVRLTGEFLPHDPPRLVEIQRLRRSIAEELERVRKRLAGARLRNVLATSGTAAAISGAAQVVESSGSRWRAGHVSRAAVVRLADYLAKLDLKERCKVPGIGPRRAEIIVAGAYVFRELMERCNLPGFRYSPLGLRDGLLAQMLADHDQATVPRRQIEAERRDALLAMCKRYGVDLKKAEEVRRLAGQLFYELRRVHALPLEYEGWLAAAALLHEAGTFINRNGRHRHTYYLIANSEIFGFTSEQRLIIAAIARYLGKTRPNPADSPMKALTETDEELVPKAVVLLRLAQAMSHGIHGSIVNVNAEVNQERVMLSLSAKASADLEVWMLSKERGYFRQVFGRELDVKTVTSDE
jgi:exopolyphosphatase/guanosine-5'-triphosphate,3'-diphosphate pyrophosphatase